MRAVAILLGVGLIATACASSEQGTSSTTPPATSASAASTAVAPRATDDRGKTLQLRKPAERIVSLSPAATEIVFALGAGQKLVAVDDFSDFPSEVARLPHLGGLRISAESVLAQRPDLILLPSYLDANTVLDQSGAPIFVLEPVDLEGVYRNIDSVGALLDRVTAAQTLVADMRTRIQAIATRARTAAVRPRVLHEIDSVNPTQIFVAGPRNFIDTMISTAGGVNVAADANNAFPQLQPEEIVRRNPDVIVLADAKYGVTLQSVSSRPGWSAIVAVQRGAVYPIDDDLVSRPGPRLVLGFEQYARLLHPELFR
jgi:iron complex transport system substrate-binding protein